MFKTLGHKSEYFKCFHNFFFVNPEFYPDRIFVYFLTTAPATPPVVNILQGRDLSTRYPKWEVFQNLTGSREFDKEISLINFAC